MEKGSILGYLEQKTILVTGATGYLGKLFVEKVLRVQPDVKRLYLVVRAADAESAAKRLQSEVLGKDLFRVLREKYRDEFDSFISSKVIPIAGDVAAENLGIEGSSLREALWREIDVLVHSAATTRFDERYDLSLSINTLGAKHVVEFSKKCLKLQILLHVSTAFVAGEKAGVIFEKPFGMGEALSGLSLVNIEEECMLVKHTLKELRAAKSTNMDERKAMRKLGMERATAFGWPNTYVFTKAMGEMLIGYLKENLPLAIVRPTMISSTIKEPFPGWIEGCRTFDSLILAYAKGHLSSYMVNLKAAMDVVPGDMVINAIIAIMVHQLNQRYEFIYHVASSSRNPMNYAMLEDFVYHYFLANPQRMKDGRLIQAHKVTFYNSRAKFYWNVRLPYKILFKVLHLANVISSHLFGGQYVNLNRKYEYMMKMVDLYEPYAFFKGIFNVQNSERVRKAMVEGCNDGKMFDFDVDSINWEEYFRNMHIPGLLKYEIK
uniref:Fatty acyl-CoA reductase n=1 Tax=Anthurium amnicola TaxID=1678845 RepID=A0A1D1YDM8_9ARAE